MIFYFLENNAQLESVSVEAFKEKPQKSMLFQNMLLSHNKYGTLFNDLTRDSITNDFVLDVYCRCLQIFYQIFFSIVISYATKCTLA